MLTSMCQLCQSHKWCGRPCMHAPKEKTPPKAKTPDAKPKKRPVKARAR